MTSPSETSGDADMPAREAQREPIVKDDLAPYRGSWVAVRDGKVISSALSSIQLKDKPDVHPGDLFIMVPTGVGWSILI
jgi:hypothetical protein